MTKSFLILLSGLLFLAAFFSPAHADNAALPVFVSIPPQAFFVERIGGEHVSVGVLVAPGQSPHAYDPTPRQLVDLARAKFFFAIGLPFERSLLSKLEGSHPNLRIVHTEEGIARRRLPTHDHGDGHAHEALDPHTWLSPKLALHQVRAIALALEAADPEHAATYRKNLVVLAAELNQLDRTIAKAFAPYRGRSFFVAHPAFGYFADAYGLVQVPIEHEGKRPGARALAGVIEDARHKGARVVFVEPQFSQREADMLARAIGGRVVTLDPLARDYAMNLRTMADRIRSAVAQER